ncbi:hypothetical protein HZS_2037 [Henneguya salminicola]|nr:hypothetical protein HZS_2037 [Henneguya salminicola]
MNFQTESYMAVTFTVDKIELLTLIPHCNIVKEIQFIETLTTVDDNKYRFWSYELCQWNTYVLNDDDVANRTNNALERYSRRLKDHSSNSHPNLACFIGNHKSRVPELSSTLLSDPSKLWSYF